MNSTHLHLVTTHLPLFLPAFGLFLLLFGALKRSEDLKRTSLLLFVFAGVLTVPTYLSGRPAQAVLMRMMPGMAPNAAEQHAEIAIVALVLSALLGVVALAGMWLFRKQNTLPGWFLSLTLVLALLASALMGWTAHLGGRIRHPEIRDTPADPAPR